MNQIAADCPAAHLPPDILEISGFAVVSYVIIAGTHRDRTDFHTFISKAAIDHLIDGTITAAAIDPQPGSL